MSPESSSSPHEPSRLRRIATGTGWWVLNSLAACGGYCIPAAESPEDEALHALPTASPVAREVVLLTAEQERQIIAQGMAFACDDKVARVMMRMTLDHDATWPHPWRDV